MTRLPAIQVWLKHYLEIHDSDEDVKGGRVRELREPDAIEESKLFGGVKFSLPLSVIPE